MALKVYAPSEIAVGNCQDTATAKKLDEAGQGFLSLETIARYAESTGRRLPRSIDEAYAFLGGPRHQVSCRPSPDWRGHYGKGLYQTTPFYSHGRFYLEGPGIYGFGTSQSRTEFFYPTGYENPPVTAVLFVFDFDAAFPELSQNLDAAELVISDLAWIPEIGCQEYLGVPMNLFTAPAEEGKFHDGKPFSLPPVTILTATVEVRDLAALVRGRSTVSFYARLLTHDGYVKHLWKDGQEGNMFDLDLVAYAGGQEAIASAHV